MTTPSLPSRYQARSLLGEGGSGRVYRVRDSIRDRELALKLVTPAESAWLRREFDTLRQIRHENLIHVFDWGTLPSGEAYYTMELLEGGDWGRWMESPQSPDEVRRVLTGLLRGLAHLHCHGEIHADLKPGNVLLGAGGVVKITDAGMGSTGGAAAGSSGTPGYVAPEVWEGARADVRSDLYSVGVMAYEALTGRHPFAGRTIREVVSGQLEGWVPSPGAHGVDVPPDLERVVMRAIERQPGLRQGSADEFMAGMGVEDRIGEILGGKLVGREKEIAEIETLLYSEEAGTQTLLHLAGEPGIGKTALVEEVAQRLSMRGGRTLIGFSGTVHSEHQSVLSDPGRELRGANPGGVAAATEGIRSMASTAPLLIWVDRSTDAGGVLADACRESAQFMWALSLERNRGIQALFVIERSDLPPGMAPFERALRLRAFGSDLVLGQIRGALGAVNLEDALIEMLRDLTGGTPGALRAAIMNLIDRGLLARRDNSWTFREIEQIKSLQLPAAHSHWTQAWDRLDRRQWDALICLALVPRGLPPELLGDARFGGGAMASLEARGWARNTGWRWVVASEGVRQAILSRASKESQGDAANKLLAAESGLELEEKAALALQYGPSEGAQIEGLEAARLAMEKGDHRTAVRLLRWCLRIAHSTGGAESARKVSLQLADSLHQLGEYSEAQSVLGDPTVWSDPRPGDAEAAAREHLLGKLYRSLGDIDSARAHFGRAIECASSRGDGTTLLSHVELAELDWRHGSKTQRDEAIRRLRSLVDERSATTSQGDPMAALTYQLGAALYASGNVPEARETLLEGAAIKASVYWRMRIAIALGSACDYLGLPDEALRWTNEAWRYAETAGFDGYKARILSNRGAIQSRLGMYRDALDQDLLSAMWARRLGNVFEYAAGCAGASINQIVLARYEDALVEACNTLRAAEQIKDARYAAKACEFQGLALFYIGEYAESELAARRGLEVMLGQENDEVLPRLDWLLARIHSVNGNMGAANEHLARAKDVLARTQDQEDLPGVEIELLRLRAIQNPSDAEEIGGLVAEVVTRSALPIVKIWGSVVLAEISAVRGPNDWKWSRVLEAALAQAEDAGVAEASWQLSYWIGVLSNRLGDIRTGQRRFGQALRILREIAGRLSVAHRESYMDSPYVRSALQRIGSARQLK